MGCTPTAQRLNSIPSCNVNVSSKSTRSTIKNSDCMLSPQKLTLDQGNNNEKYKVKRYYSPKYVPPVKMKAEGAINVNQKGNDLSKQKGKQNLRNYKQNKPVQDADIISHLSLNSQHNSRQNLQFLNYEARTPSKQRQQNRIIQKATTHQKNEQKKVQTQCIKGKKMTKQPNRRCDILQNELRDMNSQEFQRIKIEKMNF